MRPIPRLAVPSPCDGPVPRRPGGDTVVITRGLLQLKEPLLKLDNGARPVATTGTPVAGGIVGAGSPTVLSG